MRFSLDKSKNMCHRLNSRGAASNEGNSFNSFPILGQRKLPLLNRLNAFFLLNQKWNDEAKKRKDEITEKLHNKRTKICSS